MHVQHKNCKMGNFDAPSRRCHGRHWNRGHRRLCGERRGLGRSGRRYKTGDSSYAALSLVIMETCRRSLGVARHAQHRTVETRRHPREPPGAQARNDPVSRFTADLVDTGHIGAAERTADGGHNWQPLQPKYPIDPLVITTVVNISQLSVPNNQMHCQQHHRRVMIANRAHLKPETVAYRECPISKAEEVNGPNNLCSWQVMWKDRTGPSRYRDSANGMGRP